MPDSAGDVPTPVFAVDVPAIARHANPVTCLLMGRHAPLTLVSETARVTGDVLMIRPGVDHRIECGADGVSAMYLDGVTYDGPHAVASRLEGTLARLALAGMAGDPAAQHELRDRLRPAHARRDRRFDATLTLLAREPMLRMGQAELAARVGMERTQALRLFKATTGMTFRAYKRWKGLQHAAERIVAGDLVRTAALDAGFADTAHLSRTFRTWFGLTPSQAIAGLARAGQG